MIHVPSQFPTILPCHIAIVAEAPGDMEIAKGTPLIGPSGKLLNMALKAAGIDRTACFVTNVFDFQLPDNNIKRICVPRLEGMKGMPSVCAGGYVPKELGGPALSRLYAELEQVKPNVIVALGGVAVWALLSYPGNVPLKKIRGTFHWSDAVNCKLLPTYHPAYVLRQYNMYPYLWGDLLKAAREQYTPELREVHIPRTILSTVGDVQYAFSKLVPPYAVDIETVRGQIDCIGFGDGKTNFTVPLFDNKTFENFWSPADELDVRAMVNDVLASDAPKIFQNGSYDIQWLWERWRVKVRGYVHDTRLLHHSLYPELPKDLGSMAALHTDLPSWKPVKKKESEDK